MVRGDRRTAGRSRARDRRDGRAGWVRVADGGAHRAADRRAASTGLGRPGVVGCRRSGRTDGPRRGTRLGRGATADPSPRLRAAARDGVPCRSSGMFLVYSATHQTLAADGFDPFDRVKKQVSRAGDRASCCVLVIATFDYRFFKVYAGFIYAATVLLLAVLQIPGWRRRPARTSTCPARRLCSSAPRSSRRSALLVMLAAMLSELRTPEPELRDVLRVCVIAVVPMGLVFINSPRSARRSCSSRSSSACSSWPARARGTWRRWPLAALVLDRRLPARA